MKNYSLKLGEKNFSFRDLKDVLAKATPHRSGDVLAGVSASSQEERVAAQYVLSEIPLSTFTEELVIPYELDEVTRALVDSQDKERFKELKNMSVGEFREFLLMESTTGEEILRISKALLPEMVAAVSKLMRNQDLLLVTKKIEVVTRFNNTIGKRNCLSSRLQPNHPFDDPKGILVSTLDGLLYGVGDACIGINPASDNFFALEKLLHLLNDLIEKYEIPTQSCILTHLTNTIQAIEKKLPVDLIFQSIAGSEITNTSFGINLGLLEEGRQAGNSLKRGKLGNHFYYFETGQGSALSANGHHGVDQQTLEARAYGVARLFSPLLVNTVVGFIGPEYLFDGKQIIRAGLEDHFCGKVLGLPMGCDVCYTNHAEADSDDMDLLLTLLGVGGINFVMGIPGADDIMLNYQSTSFHDVNYARSILGKTPAPEFLDWLVKMGIADQSSKLLSGKSSKLQLEFQEVLK